MSSLKTLFRLSLGIGAVTILIAATTSVQAKKAPATPKQNDRCTLRLDSQSVAAVQISVNGTVLNFPSKPSEVILGKKDSFGIKYVQSDLAVSPLTAGSRSNLYVYLEGRNFTFALSTIQSGGCPKIFIRDSHETQVSSDGYFRIKK